MVLRRFASGWFVLLALAGLRCEAATFETLDGRRYEGEVVRWSSNGIDAMTADGDQSLPAASLLAVRLSSKPAGPAAWAEAKLIVVLRDGTTLPASALTIADRTVHIETPWSRESVTVSTRDVELAAFGPLSDPAREAWEKIQNDPLPGDVLLVLKKGGESVDYLAGKVEAVTETEVAFDWDGERVPVKRDKVAAVAFYRGETAPVTEPVCRLRLAGGWSLAAATIVLAEGELAVGTPLGLRLRVPLSAAESADFSAGKLAYLSDLKPLDARWTPLVELPPGATLIANFGKPRFDRAFDGGPLRVVDHGTAGAPSVRAASGDSFPKGLALRSRTQIAYNIPPGMTRFATVAGIDPACAAQGRVELTVYGDDAKLWSGEIAGVAPPQDVVVELAGSRRLRLVVDYGKNLDYGDQLHLLEARFTK